MTTCWACGAGSEVGPCVGDGCGADGGLSAEEVECPVATEAPANLLDTCFSLVQAGRLAPNLRLYEPRFEQFTGVTDKRRWLYVPPGETIDVAEDDGWIFPEGTIVWQEITDGVRLETRMNEKIGPGSGSSAWRSSVYLWTADQTNAHREPILGVDYAADVVPGYQFPDESECESCHQSSDDFALGVTALQLGDAELAGNIEEWQKAGYLSESRAPLAMVGDELDQQVLGYAHANCGTCHSPRGSVGGLGLDLRYLAATSDPLSSQLVATTLYRDNHLLPGTPGQSSLYRRVADGTMPPSSVTGEVDVAFRADLADWIRGLEARTGLVVDAAELPLSLDAATGEGRELLGYSVTATDDVEGQVLAFEDAFTFRSRAVVPIDTSKTYRVSGRFRSDGVTPTRLYFGLAPYDGEVELISAYQANRRGTATTVVTSSTTATTLVTSVAVDDWNQPGTRGHQRAIGFYFDGDTTHLPDYVHANPTNHGETGAEVGAYSTAVSTTVSLNIELPVEVLAQITDATVVQNHYSGGTYLYSAASNVTVPASWTEYSGTITGESFSPGNTAFRPETEFARVLILANYSQNDIGARLYVTDLVVEEVVP